MIQGDGRFVHFIHACVANNFMLVFKYSLLHWYAKRLFYLNSIGSYNYVGLICCLICVYFVLSGL